MAAEKSAEAADGTTSYPDAAQRSADAHRVHQPGSGSGRQQVVRVRHDPMSVAERRGPWLLPLTKVKKRSDESFW